ncbi:hypothetical protein QUA54_23600 [Microcoleus sp. MOSTC5]|uniref:hypothetical protein n=1 Tax=Microcoleus sp. MOSTC5 TaxID=3055378 RepID=UPI002FCF23C0
MRTKNSYSFSKAIHKLCNQKVYKVPAPAPAGTSAEAVAAAHRVLVNLYPKQTAT